MSGHFPDVETLAGRVIATMDFTIGVATNRHVRVRRADPCKHCTIATRWVETTYAAPLHPGRCTAVWDAAYETAGITRGPWRPMSLL